MFLNRSILFDDVVNKDVLEHLLETIFPMMRVVSFLDLRLPIWNDRGAAVQDFEGVWLDPTATTGEDNMRPMHLMIQVSIRSDQENGNTQWYRHCDGVWKRSPWRDTGG